MSRRRPKPFRRTQRSSGTPAASRCQRSITPIRRLTHDLPRDQQGRDRAFAAGLLGCRQPVVPASAAGTLAIDTANLVARGEYIVRNAATCGGCHSANERNPDGPLSGGTEFKDWRLGTIRASNLTPDSVTGLGTWSEADIVRALRSGQRKDGQVLAPVMPYLWLNRMSDIDAFAVARYLKSLPPVRNEVRQSPNLVFKVARLFLSLRIQ